MHASDKKSAAVPNKAESIIESLPVLGEVNEDESHLLESNKRWRECIKEIYKVIPTDSVNCGIEDCSLLEVSTSRGFKFPRPNWWPHGGYKKGEDDDLENSESSTVFMAGCRVQESAADHDKEVTLNENCVDSHPEMSTTNMDITYSSPPISSPSLIFDNMKVKADSFISDSSNKKQIINILANSNPDLEPLNLCESLVNTNDNVKSYELSKYMPLWKMIEYESPKPAKENISSTKHVLVFGKPNVFFEDPYIHGLKLASKFEFVTKLDNFKDQFGRYKGVSKYSSSHSVVHSELPHHSLEDDEKLITPECNEEISVKSDYFTDSKKYIPSLCLIEYECQKSAKEASQKKSFCISENSNEILEDSYIHCLKPSPKLDFVEIPTKLNRPEENFVTCKGIIKCSSNGTFVQQVLPQNSVENDMKQITPEGHKETSVPPDYFVDQRSMNCNLVDACSIKVGCASSYLDKKPHAKNQIQIPETRRMTTRAMDRKLFPPKCAVKNSVINRSKLCVTSFSNWGSDLSLNTKKENILWNRMNESFSKRLDERLSTYNIIQRQTKSSLLSVDSVAGPSHLPYMKEVNRGHLFQGCYGQKKDEIPFFHVDSVRDIKKLTSFRLDRPDARGLIKFEDIRDGFSYRKMADETWNSFENYDKREKVEIFRAKMIKVEEGKKVLASRKLCLLLYLDGTLLDSAMFNKIDPRYEEVLRMEEKCDCRRQNRHLILMDQMRMWVKLRPGIWDFLDKASEICELYFYTTGRRKFAMAIAKLLCFRDKVFFGQVLHKGCKGTLFGRSEVIPKVQDLDWIVRTEMAILIMDAMANSCPNNKKNLIYIQRYTYFPHSIQNKRLQGLSFLETGCDERLNNGKLVSIYEVIKSVHRSFFNHLRIYKMDVRNILPSEKKKVLAGCRIVFSYVFSITSVSPHLHPLWQTAEQFGAVCTTEVDEKVTHVVAARHNTFKAHWGRRTGRFVVNPGWVKTSALLFQRAREEGFLLKY